MRVTYRPARDEADRVFVSTTWRSSFRRSPSAGLISMARWWDVMGVEIADVLARPAVQILIAADPTVTDGIADLVGHLVFDGSGILPLVYFCYVKHAYRGNGFGRGLLRAAGIHPNRPFNYVCQTYASLSLLDQGRLPHARWRPLLGRLAERNDHDDE